jgi:hypothetical protein
LAGETEVLGENLPQRQQLMLLHPEGAELTVMAMPHFHNFLGKSALPAGICTPPNTSDHDVEGNLDKENMTSLFPMQVCFRCKGSQRSSGTVLQDRRTYMMERKS